jgi:hypothetical protein
MVQRWSRTIGADIEAVKLVVLVSLRGPSAELFDAD